MIVPEGWDVRPLGNVAGIQTGLAKNKASVPDPVNLPYLRVANVQDGYLDLEEVKLITVDRSKIERYRLRAGDVLLTEGGDFDKLGRGTVWREEIELCLHQNHVFAVRVHAGVVIPEFLSALTSSAHGKQYFLDSSKQTTNLASINTAQLREFPVLLPPLPEQQKIAAILSSVDEAIEKTQAVIDQVQVVKKGLMQELLTRGLPGRHSKFKQTEIGEIPEEWEVAAVSRIVANMQYGTSEKCHTDQDGVPVLRIPNVVGGRVVVEPLKYAKVSPDDVERYRVHEGDVLVVRTNGNPDYVARSVAVRAMDRVYLFASYLIRLQLDEEQVSPVFLQAVLESPATRERMRGAIRTSAGNYNINTKGIAGIIVPLPPLEEQRDIVCAREALEYRLDAEIKAVTALQTLKQSLMSVLLTGELRVTP